MSKVPTIEGVSKAANSLFSELDNPNFQLQTTSTGSGISEDILINEGYDSAYRQGLKNALPCWKATKESNPSKFNSYIFNCPAPMLGLREVVRIKCDKMMTQSDINVRVTSADIEQLSTNHFIAMSCWFVDIHKKLELGKTIPTDCRGIAYEMLIPVNLKNVLLGCKCFGASHVASAACRITKTMMSIGNAAGYAAEDFCKNYRDDVRNCDIDYIQKSVDIEGQIQKTELLY